MRSLVLLLPLCLAACIEQYGTDRFIESTRWIDDSTVAYSTVTAEWVRDGGNVLGGGTIRYTSTSLRIFTVGVRDGQCADPEIRYTVTSVVPCSQMLYRPEDSLLYFSYIPFSDTLRDPFTTCDFTGALPPRLLAGKPTRYPFSPLPRSLDTAALLATLDTSLSVPDPAINTRSGSFFIPNCNRWISSK